ncbi:VanZ family protein [Chloroflexus aggregans]|uniref:VanZ family protein n=1 Tax=Chloroflexus aggregans (strain MD-66 / DSM 9485) TaxID=326427 RepID=B8G9G8_CHLAD|nr:VanZ family protein [Chloroflexus aggregans]ACL24458.1 VanZ family protein [Chloroflexus aggregans DSM 9485]
MSRWCDARDPRLVRYGVALLLPVLVGIFSLTLYPFDFSDPWPPQPWYVLGFGFSHGVDMLQNVILFVPLGVALSWVLAGFGMGRRGQIGGVFIVAAVVAFGIECAQLLVPGRTAALLDVLANAGGAALGGWVLAPLAMPVVDQITRTGLSIVQRVPAIVAVGGMVVWLVSAGWAQLHWQRATLPVNWSERYTFQIGAASDGRRFWPGYVGFVALYDRAFDQADAQAVLTPDNAFARAPLLAYDFTHYPPVQAGPLVRPLVVQGKPTFTTEGVGVGYQRWLASTEPLSGVAGAVARSRAFTLVAQVAPHEPTRATEGLMINYGRQIDAHNISLIQAGSDLLVRMRLPFTRPVDDRPPLRFADVFHDAQPRVVAFSYDGVVARLFVDGQLHRQWYAFGPGEVLVNRLFPVQSHQIGGWSSVLAVGLSMPLVLVGLPWRDRRWWMWLPALVGPLIVGSASAVVAVQPLSSVMMVSGEVTVLIGSIVLRWLTKPWS